VPADLSFGLAPLTAVGARIVSTTTGEPVRLCGVNRSGLEYAEPDASRDFLAAVGITEDEIATIARDWGARIIRLPFNQDFVLHGRRGRTAADYLDALDRVVAWAARHGCYTLLDLQWLDADRVFGMNADYTWNRVPPLPDARTADAWATLASRYRDEPAVLFDLFNEPHDPLPDDSAVLDGVSPEGVVHPLDHRRVRMTEWQPWARHLIATIRAEHPASLIFVSGIRWAYDLRGMPLASASDATPVENVVYSTHVYPWCRTGPLSWGSYEQDWHRAFGHLAGRVPLFVGEWGGTADHVEWGTRLMRYLDTHRIGWTAWSWADWPHLVVDCRACDYAPTSFGALVHAALRHA
jgi:endoglucanase